LAFFIFTLASGLLLLPFTYYNYHYYVEIYTNAPKDYQFPVITDFRECLLLSVVIQVTIWSLSKIFYYLYIPCSKGRDSPEELEMRCSKAGRHTSLALYMICSTWFGFKVMKDADFFPT
jgi:hypothetical protein